VVVDLYVYSDESGTEDGATLCLVAGHIGSPRQWNKFNQRWRSILASENVEEFHARDFFQRRSWQSSASAYHGWTVARADAFLSRLVETISVCRILPVGCAVPLADFKAQNEGLRRFITGARGVATLRPDGSLTSTLTGGAPLRPYQAAWMVLVVDALEHARSEAMVHFVFDEQHEYAPYALQQYAAIKKTWPPEFTRRLGGISYESSHDHPGVQVADLYCYLQGRGLVYPERVTPSQLAALKVLNKRREGIMVQTTDVHERMLDRLGNKILAEFLRQANELPPLWDG
jgi:hypothetical protein